MKVQYGYRVGDVLLPDLPEQRAGSKIVKAAVGDESDRPIVAASLGFNLVGQCLPHVDPLHQATVEAGARKRIVGALPVLNQQKISEFKKFVQRFVSKNFDPLPADTDVSVGYWLDHSNYPLWRRQQLDAAPPLAEARDPFNCKSFVKDEHYPEYKHARTINSRSDSFKKFSGPIFAAIEKVVFTSKYFIKKIPVSERARYVVDNVYVPCATYFATDFSSFETSFTKEIMEACEFVLYSHMSANVVGGAEWFGVVKHALSGKQTLKFKNITVQTQATRMSGDMCTSLGNGFTNLMLALFMGEQLGLGELRGVFEGDDGLGTFSRGTPDGSFFKDMGFSVKLELHDRLEWPVFAAWCLT